MPWKYSEEYYREYTRTTWNDSASAYQSLSERFAPFRAELIRELAPTPGLSVLDLGTGPGEPAMTIALGPLHRAGKVLGVDLSEKMIELATQSARERQLTNVDFRVMDCSSLDLPDHSVDAVVSSFGFQIFTDPAKAAQECRRVLRPGGRIVINIWGTAENVPFLHAVVGPMLSHAEPDETGYLPTPYETGGPGEMVGFLTEAGFREARERRSSHTLVFENAEEYLATILQGTPIGHSLSEEPVEVQEAVLRAARSNLERHRTAEGIRLAAEVVYVSATA